MKLVEKQDRVRGGFGKQPPWFQRSGIRGFLSSPFFTAQEDYLREIAFHTVKKQALLIGPPAHL